MSLEQTRLDLLHPDRHQCLMASSEGILDYQKSSSPSLSRGNYDMMGHDERPALLGQTPEELARWLRGPGRAKMVFKSLREGHHPLENSELSQRLKQTLTNTFRFSPKVETQRSRAQDGTLKLLFELYSGYLIESVLIPAQNRTTLCLSTQVGCARACQFCLTGTMGLKANLNTDEIVSQVYRALQVVKEESMPTLRNIVFMGMGEPLDNWMAVNAAITSLTDMRGFGFGPRHVTVSTVAPSPQAVGKLVDCPTRIAWSLHAANDATRKRLVATQRHSITELAAAFRQLFMHRSDPLFVEMTLIDGLNDRSEDAAAAIALLKGFPSEVRFNLLPLNPSTKGYVPSKSTRVSAFARQLREAGYFTMIRVARGQDKGAACGQLVTLGQSPEQSAYQSI